MVEEFPMIQKVLYVLNLLTPDIEDTFKFRGHTGHG